MLLNVGPYIYDVSVSGFTRSSIYIHDISSLRVNLDRKDISVIVNGHIVSGSVPKRKAA